MASMKRLLRTANALLRAIDAAVAVLKFVAVVLAVLVGLVVVAAAVVAYLKREQWTKPAYRWARDKSGRWGMTPWTPAEPGAAEPGAVVEPIPADNIAS
jgi:hypothetical protein